MGVEGAYAGGRPVYFVDGGRTPFLKARGTPGPCSSADLAVAAGKALLARQPFAPEALDEVVFGCIIPGPDEANIARIIAMRLGCGPAAGHSNTRTRIIRMLTTPRSSACCCTGTAIPRMRTRSTAPASGLSGCSPRMAAGARSSRRTRISI